jgi:hypothetical protein
LVSAFCGGIIFYREDRQADFMTIRFCWFVPDFPEERGCPAFFMVIMMISI